MLTVGDIQINVCNPSIPRAQLLSLEYQAKGVADVTNIEEQSIFCDTFMGTKVWKWFWVVWRLLFNKFGLGTPLQNVSNFC